MNFKTITRNVPRQEPALDMDRLAREIERDEPSGLAHLRYAPPAVRTPAVNDASVEQIKAFASLPTKELDDLISETETRLASLKSDAQAIRDVYVKHTTRLAAEIRRLQANVNTSLETMADLRKTVTQLDEEEIPGPGDGPHQEGRSIATERRSTGLPAAPQTEN